MPRTRSKSSSAPSTWVHWIQAEERDSQEAFVQRADAVKLAQAHLQLDIAREQLGLGAHADTRAQHLSRRVDVHPPDLKVGIREPQLCCQQDTNVVDEELTFANVKLLCGTSLMAALYTSLARSKSFVSISSNAAY